VLVGVEPLVEVKESLLLSEVFQPEVGKVTLKSNVDEALSDEFLLKNNSDEALNYVFPHKKK
jgi:hypothetical protein